MVLLSIVVPFPSFASDCVAAALRTDVELFGSSFLPRRSESWYSDSPRDITSRGSPWEVDWEGVFALCAPSWAPDSTEPALQLLTKISRRALEACCCPRPTRIGVMIPTSYLRLTSRGLVASAEIILGLRDDLHLLVFQNTTASALAPINIPALVKSLGNGAFPNCSGSFRAWTRFREERTEALPFPVWAQDSGPRFPPWAERDPTSPAFEAFNKLTAFDYYAGSLGVLPSFLAVALAATASHSFTMTYLVRVVLRISQSRPFLVALISPSSIKAALTRNYAH